MNTYKFFDCSPKAQARIDRANEGLPVAEKHLIDWRSKYPLECLNVGKCFLVPFVEANEPSLRNVVARANSRNVGKRFAVIKHEEYKVFEVARIK